jgi:multicomponent Na+:H+ antiporter subunit B
MNGRARAWVGGLGIAGIAALLLVAFSGLPSSGHYPGPYGDVVSPLSVFARHTTDAVSAVNFDIRGLDTLGEEFILFTSALGVSLLLRQSEESGKNKGDGDDAEPARKVAPTSDAIRTFGAATVGFTALFGLYIVSHGDISPGGGFQGGVVLATAPLVVYLCSSPEIFERIAPRRLVDGGEALGAAGYALIGLAGVVFGGALLQNVVPLGKTGAITGGGTILLINLTVGLEVAGGIVLLMLAFLDEALRERRREREH